MKQTHGDECKLLLLRLQKVEEEEEYEAREKKDRRGRFEQKGNEEEST